MRHEFRVAGILAAALLVFSILAFGVSPAHLQSDRVSEHDRIVAAIVHAPEAGMALVTNTSSSCPTEQVNGWDTGGCCTICAPALLAFDPALILEEFPSAYVLPYPADFVSADPPPEFRPPRASA